MGPIAKLGRSGLEIGAFNSCCNVYTIQPVVKPVVNPVWQPIERTVAVRWTRLSNRVCETGCTTGL